MSPKTPPSQFNLSDKQTRYNFQRGLENIGKDAPEEFSEVVPQMWSEVHRVYPDLAMDDTQALISFTEGFWLGLSLEREWKGPRPTIIAATLFVLDIIKAVDELEAGVPE